MISHARRLIGPLALALLLGGCGDGDGTILASGSSTTSQDGAGTAVELSDEFCRQLDSEEPGDALVESAPAAYRDAVAALVEFTSVMDASGSDEAAATDDVRRVADLLSADGVDEELAALGAAATDRCPDSQGASYIGSFATAATFVRAERDPAYCDALRTAIEQRAEEPDLGALAELAPAEHRDGLARLGKVLDGGEPDAEAAAMATGVFFGLGLYGEARCEIPGAFTTMAIAGAFMGMAGDGGTGGVYDDSADAIAESSAADPAAATGLVGAGDLAFEARTIALDDDDTYRVSAVVPTGWEPSDSFGVTFEPPSDSNLSIFTELRFDTGCDGVCEPTDWQARLRGPDGYLTSTIGDATITSDRAVEGSDGAVVTTMDDDGSVDGYVLRWDDARSKYFLCIASLEADQASWLDAFVAACESSRPGWIPVG